MADVRYDERGVTVTPEEFEELTRKQNEALRSEQQSQIERQRILMERAQEKIDGDITRKEARGATVAVPKPLFYRVNEPQYPTEDGRGFYEKEPLDNLRWSVALWLTNQTYRR